MNEYLRGPFVSSKAGSADMAWMDNGHIEGCRWENVEDWCAGGETCLQRGRDAPCLLWGNTLLVCPMHGLLLIHHLNSAEGSLLKGFFEEPGTATQVAGSFSVLLGPSGSVSFPPVSPRSHLCNNDSEANYKCNCLADGLGSYWLALS